MALMDSIPENVAKRYELLTASRSLVGAAPKGEQLFIKFQRGVDKADKLISQLPRMFKTYDRQTTGYKTTDPVKAEATAKKILAKVEAVGKECGKVFDFVEKWARSYSPPNDDRKRTHDEFKNWLDKMDKAIVNLRGKVRETDTSLPYFNMGLGKFDPEGFRQRSEHPVLALPNAARGVAELWKLLLKPEPDPVNIPRGGSDIERFKAFITPSVKRLAKGAASKLKKDKGAAAILVWSILENVNAHGEARTAESILSPLVDEDAITEKQNDTILDLRYQVSGDVDYGVVEAGAFGVALMQAVGENAYAEKLGQALAKGFAEYTKA